ncbi:MAG: class I SAM-dependent methyltransferase [Candidatus Omnitrophica bacterium]|nr:class I SAM-dependent methyltransferase [Candidatus Omnitrophota bacterium]
MRHKDGEGIERLILEREVLENHKRYLERKKLYQSHGFDIDKERKFVLDKAEPLFGDILEVGTGKGHFTLILAKEGYKFTSVDVFEEEQDIARLNLRYFGLEDYVDFKIENAEHLSLEDNSFDIIFSINTVHHLEAPFKVMDELVRIVSFEGKIILSDFSKQGLGVVDRIHRSEGRSHRASIFNLNDIARYLLGKDFKIEKHRDRFQEIIIACR